MPIFDYECLECQKKFAYKHSSKNVIKICESCGGELEKLLFESLNFSQTQEDTKAHEAEVLRRELKDFKRNLKREDYEP